MNINELMEKLPIESAIVKDEDVKGFVYYKDSINIMVSEPFDYYQKPNETFTQFIQRIVENE